MDKTQKVQDLLRMAKSTSGNVHEAHLAAKRAVEIARENDLGGHLVARCLVLQGKTQRRLDRSQLPSYA